MTNWSCHETAPDSDKKNFVNMICCSFAMQKGFQSHLEGKPTNAGSVLCESAFLCTMCGDEVKSTAIEVYDPLTDNWQFYNLCVVMR